MVSASLRKLVLELVKETYGIRNYTEKTQVKEVLNKVLAGEDVFKVDVPTNIHSIKGWKGTGHNSGTRAGRNSIVRHNFSEYEPVMRSIKRAVNAELASKSDEDVTNWHGLEEPTRVILQTLVEALAVRSALAKGIKDY